MIKDNEIPYLEALSFFYDSDTKMVICTCGNTFNDEDSAESHWFSEHNPY